LKTPKHVKESEKKTRVVNKTVNNFQATLVKIERRIQSLETSYADTKRDVKGLKENLNLNEIELYISICR